MWEPLWEVANGLKVPLAFHLTGVRGFAMPWRRILPFQEWGAGDHLTSMIILCAGVAETVSWFAAGGVLEKYPDLTVVMTEAQAGWLGWTMGCLDHFWAARFSRGVRETGEAPQGGMSMESMKEMLGDHIKLTEAPPSYYIKRQVKCTFTDDPSAIVQRHFTGLDCLMWGNDYPHPEGVVAALPGVRREGVRRLARRRGLADRPRQRGEGLRLHRVRPTTG